MHFCRCVAALACVLAMTVIAHPALADDPIIVIDGDTVEQAGERWRLLDIDAPEIGSAKCASERQSGLAAAARLIDLLKGAAARIEPATRRKRDKYGRRLGRLLINGKDWADIAVTEGLAVRWEGYRHTWCK